jgi:tetratricopeptide (TPR) repeat protein
MATTKERPDPYGPRRKAIATPAVTVDLTTATPAELLTAGLRAMTHEHPEDARSYLAAVATPEALASGEPLAIDALAYLSSVRWSLADVDGAMEAADEALELGPERFAPNQKAGEMALRLGDLERAADLFLAAVRATEPGTADSKAAEISLREARRRVGNGIRHEARTPRLTGWLSRVVPRRRRNQTPGSVTAL